MQAQRRSRGIAIHMAVLICVAFAFVAYAQDQTASKYSLADDWDQDGLSNDEERLYGTNPHVRDTDGDGYSDGVEVRSGYDPLVHASQGDRIVGLGWNAKVSDGTSGASRNLTAVVNAQVAGVALDVLSGKEVALDDINKEINDLIEKEVSLSAELPQVDVSQIRVLRQDYNNLTPQERDARIRQDVSTYTTAVSYLASLYSPVLIGRENDVTTSLNNALLTLQGVPEDPTKIAYFSDIASRGKKMLEELRYIQVPEIMLPVHMEGMQMALYAVNIGGSMDQNMVKNDPMAFVVELSKVQILASKSADFSNRLTEILRTYGIL